MRPGQRFRSLAAQLEERFPVSRWRQGDLDVWPLTRTALFLDLYWSTYGAPPAQAQRAWPRRLASLALRPLSNTWHSRRDLRHVLLRPRRAAAVFLGDGVTLDRVDGAWRDRFCEPLIGTLAQLGRASFLMQAGGLARLPWQRPTFIASTAEAWGQLLPAPTASLELPEHGRLLEFLAREGVATPALRRDAIARRAAAVASTARIFEWILARVRPQLAFVVSYFAGPAPAFVLACRRRAIPCIDLQRAPYRGAPMAYDFASLPQRGYCVLPDVFWSWNEDEARDIGHWAHPPHYVFAGGHTQLAAPRRAWQAARYEREILVALQPVGGQRAALQALAEVIRTAPRTWRWWLRRHPASSRAQDVEFGALLELRQPNIVLEAAEAPLPELLPHMSALVSVCSGSAVEAALFGVPAFFLSEEAAGPFASLIARGAARIVGATELVAAIAASPCLPLASAAPQPPDLADALARLEALLRDRSRRASA